MSYNSNMISKEKIQNLAQLARLTLDEAEVASLQKDISNILEYVGQLSGDKTVSTAPEDVRGWSADTVLPPVRNVMREDTPRRADDPLADKRESIVSQFPKREGDYNVVRKIIQKDE